MDVTELKDKTVIELTAEVEKPRPPRSRKPTEDWSVGTRFRVRSWEDRRFGQRAWELQHLPKYGRETMAVTLLTDPELFVRLLRNARLVDDLAALLAVCNQAADAILAELIRTNLVRLHEVKSAAAHLQEAEDAADEQAAKEAEGKK